MKRIVSLILCVVLLSLVLSFNIDAIGTNGKAAILINAQTNEIIYEYNSRQRLPMASTTKIMTGLLLCEHGDFDRKIVVTPQMVSVEGSSMGLLPGDTVTLHDLLYGLMLASGNDAANVIAFVLGGTVDGFVKQMNNKAKELCLNDTNFETPSGLDSKEHYTTAYDLAILTSFALKNQHFLKAVSTKSAVLNYGNPPYRRTLTNHNKLLNTSDNIIGVKTGYTKKSGRCLVSAAEEDGKRVVAVTLNNSDDWAVHKELLNKGLNEVKTQKIIPPKTDFTIPVIGSDNENLEIKIEPFEVNVVDSKDINCKVYLPEFLYAPIKKDEQIGSVVYKKGEEVICKKELLASSEIKTATIKKGFLKSVIDNIKDILISIWEK